ncbi:MAG: N-6 DNA methylase [Betaproteobacteria bacterium]
MGQTVQVTAPATIDTSARRKARGAFFTPKPLAEYVANWAVRAPSDSILEPSCGEAAFLLAAVERLTALGPASATSAGPTLHGVEMHEASAAATRDLLAQAGAQADIVTADFFTVLPEQRYDAVIGNPPYIRYQDFNGTARSRSRAAALRAGVPLSGLASSWAAFTVHASLFLKPGGRIGLVVPAELLTVNYAAPVRRFLMERFATVRLVMFTERIFGPDVLEEVVLLLADGYHPSGKHGTDHFELFEARNTAALSETVVARTWKPTSPADKWTPSLMSTEALTAYTGLTAGEGYCVLETWGDTTLGMVTGNNKYFALSPSRAADLRLRPTDLIPLSPPGSRHLRGMTFTESARIELGKTGSATYLFRPPGEPSNAAAAYIAAGETAGVQTAYKCRVRTPWWRVPLVKPADLLLTYMNADTPRLCTNRAKVHHLNSVHGVYLRPKYKRLGLDMLPLASLNSLTLLGAETVGRAYGGGMLKLEPREADRLPVPSPDLVRAAQKALSDIRPQMGIHLRTGQLTSAARLVDNVLLIGELGMSRADVGALRDAHAELTARRTARNARGSD